MALALVAFGLLMFWKLLIVHFAFVLFALAVAATFWLVPLRRRGME